MTTTTSSLALDVGGRTRPLLFDALPALARDIPWRPLAKLPTPVERIGGSAARWLGRDDLWIKRDDLASPLYGGNKVRRYELVLADAERRGAKRIVTAGGVASTQVMATALFGRALGFEVRVVLYDQPITRFAKHALLVDADSGAELIWGGNYLTTALRTIDALLRDRRENFLILPGASDPLANLGYVDAMLELAQQVERGECPRPDAIVLPTGSSGTLAALALGAAWLGWDTEIVGVRIAPLLTTNRVTIGGVIGATDRFLHAREPERWKKQRGRARFSLHHGAIGPGYGHPTPAAIDAIDHVRALIGAEGEVTYSGKALDGLRTIAAEPRWRGKNVMMWSTLSAARPTVSAQAREKLPPRLRALLDAPEVA
ncbi:1-aminocyclopropane-1-carboxylate deaminase/D-cysteine desulfhydrase [Sandaracinus amylolyticus]|uniref:1-aminocyclopropane-1-carboxylate deaminase/D-cysteine desulfhydrase n=1 Tax=Sandaracinus amylolyticus TaxID=927083 RepID=UPI001F47F4D0|nr:pyridoxal-phosphate dependent enzyme [Sandaracinus amylolyticus]UJR83410.1 Hypothetical protein I5071_54780 [Sandaracinus amylolyticus]